MRKYYYSDNTWGGIVLFLIIFSIIASIIITYKASYINPHTETITVTEKNIHPGSKQEKWLIYTENEVYCITDLFWVGFFNSSDVYNSIKPGKTYRVYVSGSRWPLFSSYKVIRKAQEYDTERK